MLLIMSQDFTTAVPTNIPISMMLMRYRRCWSGVELDEGGDPPRIWSPFGEYPGTAFTRSMGDVIAEELGVTADPEIIRRRIHPDDK